MELVGRETHETLIAEMKRSYGLQPRLVTRLALIGVPVKDDTWDAHQRLGNRGVSRLDTATPYYSVHPRAPPPLTISVCIICTRVMSTARFNASKRGGTT